MVVGMGRAMLFTIPRFVNNGFINSWLTCYELDIRSGQVAPGRIGDLAFPELLLGYLSFVVIGFEGLVGRPFLVRMMK
jgi:hypothetical protein